jgi:chaperonin GroES
MKQVSPLENRILVLPSDPLQVTKGGIVIPDSAREKQSEGTVVQTGPGKRNEAGELVPLTVQEGDVVIYSKYAGTDIQIEGKDHVLLRDLDCLAKITEVEAPVAVEA